jgi:hypothetical protein
VGPCGWAVGYAREGSAPGSESKTRRRDVCVRGTRARGSPFELRLSQPGHGGSCWRSRPEQFHGRGDRARRTVASREGDGAVAAGSAAQEAAPVVTIDADSDLHETFAAFRTHAVRRLAIVRDDQFVGMITVDDLLMDLAADLGDLARPVTAEVIFGHHDAPVPAVT